jgi:chromosomal replication initiator protein
MANLNKKEVWDDVLESIKISVSDANFKTWFSQTHLSSVKKVNNRLIAEIGCPSSYAKSTIESRYYGLLQETLTKSIDIPCDLIFIVKQNPNKTSQTKDTPLFKQKENISTNDEIQYLLQKSNIRYGFTFDNYAVSSSNQMAWAASDAVSKNPGTAYNPLFIWGGVGVGKTHLMLSIGHRIILSNQDTKVVFCTGEDFTNDIVEGIRNKSTQEVRNKYRKINALLIDDIQFIAGKDTVQEEFFHTFNTVNSVGGQIVLTSDKPPTEIPKIEERLRSRFEAGLIVDVSPPDFELRCAIIQIKAKERGLEIPVDLVHTIASNLHSARVIEGFLVKLVSEINLKNSEISQDLITNLLGKRTVSEEQQIRANPNEVISAVAKYFSINKRALLSKVRARPVARPRQVLMYILRTELGLPLQEIGRIVDRDHTTVIHAVDTITNLASTNVQTREDIVGIKNML